MNRNLAILNPFQGFVFKAIYFTGLMVRSLNTVFGVVQDLVADLILAVTPRGKWYFWNDYLYGRHGAFRQESQKYSLYYWEEDAIAGHFPKPPAHILVLAAGSGREPARLLEMGYQVSAVEPVKALYENLKTLPLVEVYNHTFQELSEKFSKENKCYDAIIIGWGAFSHIETGKEREALLNLCSMITKNGPTLVSWIGPSYLPRWRRFFRKLLSSVGLNEIFPEQRFSFTNGPYCALEEAKIHPIVKNTNLKITYRGALDRYPHMIVKRLN